MKNYIKLNKDEMRDCIDIQKKMIEAIAEKFHKYEDQKSFEIFSVAISLVISNMLTSLGVSKIDVYLNDMTRTVKQIHEKVKKNSSYMQYQYGKKISEGEFN
jgi:hypothetical protein